MKNIFDLFRCLRSVSPQRIRKATIPKTLKSRVWTFYIGNNIGQTKCLCCNNFDILQMNFECGHVLAESCGGETTVDNLRPICSQCNKSMGNMHMVEFQQKYFKDTPSVDKPIGKL